MKKITLFSIVLICFSILVLASSNGANESYGFSYSLNAEQKVEKTYKSSDFVTIEIEPEDELTLYIPANATTGYQWVLKDDFQAEFAQLISSQYIAPDSQMMGAGGTSVWVFKAHKEGLTTLAFEYIRPWEVDEEPEIVLLIQVRVKSLD